MSKSFQPDWISPPGNTIYDILIERQISVNLFAVEMGFTRSQADNLIEGINAITNDIAEKLACYLGASCDFWLKRELLYRNSIVNQQKTEEEEWLSSLPVKELIKFGFISSKEDRFTECLHFFNTPNIGVWNNQYRKELDSVRFRTSPSFENQPGSVATWIRMGEIQTESIQCNPWSAEAFQEALNIIRPLTRQKDPRIFIPKLIAICAACGVAVGIVRTPSGCSASGATKFINSTRALLILSFRYLSDDHFWFTFFHEVGHLLLHGKESLFIESKDIDIWDKREQEANNFSAEILIPKEYKDELFRVRLDKRSIIDYATRVGVSPGIIIGQMQFLRRIKPSYYNSYKRRYQWE